ncbi:MAG: hypothetical protein AAGF11_04075 [Myxococcota bacterium]
MPEPCPVVAARPSVLLAVLGLTLAGCVYPTSDPTGMELSWRFVEHDQSEGESDDPADGEADEDNSVMVRSCAGALTEQIAVEVEDQDSPRRRGIFRFDCLEGYQTANALQTEASNAFIPLDPGPYTVTMHAVDDAQNAIVSEQVETRDVTVEERIITVATWELSRAPVDWNVELRGADACESMTLALYYATPENDLADYTPNAEQSLLLYRRSLSSDRGLTVGGEATACSPELSGTHVFEGLDRGDYRLEIVVDGASCGTQSVNLRDREGASSVIDLANLLCGG